MYASTHLIITESFLQQKKTKTLIVFIEEEQLWHSENLTK